MTNIDKELESYLSDRDLNLGPEQKTRLYNYVTKRELALLSRIKEEAPDKMGAPEFGSDSESDLSAGFRKGYNSATGTILEVIDNIAKEIRGKHVPK